MSSLVLPQVATPASSDKKVRKRIGQLNVQLANNAKSIAQFDPTASRARFWFTLGMAAISLFGTIFFLIMFAVSDDLAKAITSGAAVVGLLLTAGFVNPLQTVERDALFRRWSDVIAQTYLIQAQDETLPASALKGPADDASARFTSLATAYAAVSNKALETLQIIAKPTEEKKEEEGEDPKTISVTTPGEQSSVKGSDLDPPLQIQATGGESLSYGSTTLPSGLTIDSKTGKITGKIAAEATTVEAVKITVADAGAGLEASVSFKWKIEEAKAPKKK